MIAMLYITWCLIFATLGWVMDEPMLWTAIDLQTFFICIGIVSLGWKIDKVREELINSD